MVLWCLFQEWRSCLWFTKLFLRVMWPPWLPCMNTWPLWLSCREHVLWWPCSDHLLHPAPVSPPTFPPSGNSYPWLWKPRLPHSRADILSSALGGESPCARIKKHALIDFMLRHHVLGQQSLSSHLWQKQKLSLFLSSSSFATATCQLDNKN